MKADIKSVFNGYLGYVEWDGKEFHFSKGLNWVMEQKVHEPFSGERVDPYTEPERWMKLLPVEFSGSLFAHALDYEPWKPNRIKKEENGDESFPDPDDHC